MILFGNVECFCRLDFREDVREPTRLDECLPARFGRTLLCVIQVVNAAAVLISDVAELCVLDRGVDVALERVEQLRIADF